MPTLRRLDFEVISRMRAAEAVVQTFGGFVFAGEYDIERKSCETRLHRMIPISTNLNLSLVADRILGMLRGY